MDAVEYTDQQYTIRLAFCTFLTWLCLVVLSNCWWLLLKTTSAFLVYLFI